jgi:hypothetical protein
MGEIAWLAAAANRDIEPHRRIMFPHDIRYDLLEPQVRGLVHALNETYSVETLWSCAGHPFDEREHRGSMCSAAVLLHIVDERSWREAALAIARAVRPLAGVTMLVSFDHEGQLRFSVPTWLEPARQRMLLDAALDAAERAVRDWNNACATVAAGD